MKKLTIFFQRLDDIVQALNLFVLMLIFLGFSAMLVGTMLHDIFINL